MVSVRKRKMARSSVKKNTRRVKDQQRKPKIPSHPVIAKQWDKKLTVKQNYKKLGLAISLDRVTGGEERPIETVTEYRKRKELEAQEPVILPEDIATETDPAKIPEGEARLVRDPETNQVVQVIYGTMKKKAAVQPETKPLIVDDLEKYYAENATTETQTVVRGDRQIYWLEQLEAKYGDDYERMKWDKELNPTFMAPGQLRRKFKLWRKDRGIV